MDKPKNPYADPHWNDDGPVSGQEAAIWEEGFQEGVIWAALQNEPILKGGSDGNSGLDTPTVHP